MEIKLTDNSKIHLKWVNTDRLVLELHRPATLKDGHGFLLVGSAVLSGDELTAFMAEVSRTQDTQEVRQ